MLKQYLSKKLIMTLVGVVLVPLMQSWGVPQDTINWLIGLIGAYVGGQALVDTSKGFSLTDTTK